MLKIEKDLIYTLKHCVNWKEISSCFDEAVEIVSSLMWIYSLFMYTFLLNLLKEILKIWTSEKQA